MKLLVGHAATAEFVTRLNAAAAALPVIGAPNAARFIALAHYSSDAKIEHFAPRLDLATWTDIVSQDQSQLYKITGLCAATFKAVYVIRLGLPADVNECEHVQYHHSGGNCSEYAVGYDIPRTHFARIPLVAISSSIEFASRSPVA